jgi:hypothetical protein
MNMTLKKDTYYGVPRWILYSLMPIALLLLTDILPNMVKSLYAAYADTLVFSYVVIVMTFMVVVLGLVFSAAIGDFLATRDFKVFGWRPGEAYYSGTDKKKEKKD